MSLKYYGEQVYFEDTVVFPNDSGSGIKLGRFAETAAFGWRMQPVPIQIFGGAGASSPQVYTDPTWSRLASSPFYGYKFALNNAVMLPVVLPHDIVPASSVRFGVHWVADNADSPLAFQTNAVTWSFEYMYAKGFAQAALAPNAGTASPNPQAAVTVATAGSATPHTLITSITDALALATEPSGLVYLRLKRISNTTSPLNQNTNDIYALTAALYYQSTNLATKQRSPDFYAD